MKHVKIEYIDPPYPIGRDMQKSQQVVEQYVKGFLKLKPKKKTGYNIWCRGSSGAILSALFVAKLPEYNFMVAHIKKQREDSHNSYPMYSVDNENIVLDDFSASGATIEAILKEMKVNKVTPNILILMYGIKGGWNTLFKVIISSD